MSTQWPSQLYFQPWYTQRRPSSSLRPKKSDAPRCGQWFWISPILPDGTRKVMRVSPKCCTRLGSDRPGKLVLPAHHETDLNQREHGPPDRRGRRRVVDAGGLLQLAADLDHARAHDLCPERKAAHDVRQDQDRQRPVEN